MYYQVMIVTLGFSNCTRHLLSHKHTYVSSKVPVACTFYQSSTSTIKQLDYVILVGCFVLHRPDGASHQTHLLVWARSK
ncbi:unnamed protein product, partial [Ceratitis capitata]